MENLIIVPAPSSASASARWWPDLYVKKARKLYPVTPEQCALLMEAVSDGRGASEMRQPWIDLFDMTGEKIGRVSYNGRVWLHDIEGDIEVPQMDRKTCAQRDAEGWRDSIATKGGAS